MSIIQVNTIRSKSGSSAPTFDEGLVVSGVTGVTTLGTVKVTAGFITATSDSLSGIVTYYGDGQYLQNAGIAITYIPNNLRIVGITTINSQLHVGSGVTVNAQGVRASGIVTALSYRGDGRSLTGIVTQIVAGTNITIVSSGTSAGSGIVTISAFDEQNYFQQTATGVHTTANVGIGTTNSPWKLTVQGSANITGVVTASGGFVGSLTGTASNATTATILDASSDSGAHYITFANGATGTEELRTDTNLNYSPDTDQLNVGILNAYTDVQVPKITVGSGGTVFTATADGKVGIGSTTIPNYVLEVGYPGLTGTTEYVNGDLETSQHIRIGASANITGVITATTFYGNGSGLVGVASTVQTYLQEFTSSGTFNQASLPFRANWIYVQCVGGGGAGNSRSTCSGGGAGGVVERLLRAKDLPDVTSVIIGLGGTNSTTTAGQDGGPSSFEIAADNFVRAGGGGGARNANIGGGYGGDGNLQYAGDFFITNGSTSANVGGHGYSSAGGASGGTVSISARGGSSVIGPGAGGAANAGIGGTSLRRGGPLGGLYASSMGVGGNGGNNSSLPTNGGFPGGGGGGNSVPGSPSGAGGNGVVRVWAW
jgi:hypothetical protein